MQDKIIGGRYRIEQQLGKGAFGETYLAHDEHLPKHPYCVVKHLQPINTNPKNLEIAKRLFHKEAEILVKLGEHPQIPYLYAYFIEGKDFYLVQEFIDGHSLYWEMQEEWSLKKVYDFLVEMMSILEFIHNKGVIHRDIKPANILRKKTDNKLVLIDFGAIKEVSQTGMEDSEKLTTSIIIGTKGYMAPEQSYGKPRFNSDIYSVGIIAIEALTSKRIKELNENTNTGEILWKEQIPYNSLLIDIISKMTLYDHKVRYKRSNQVLNDLAVVTKLKTTLCRNQSSTSVKITNNTQLNPKTVTSNQLSVETQKQEEIEQPTITNTKLINQSVTIKRQIVTPQKMKVVYGNDQNKLLNKIEKIEKIQSIKKKSNWTRKIVVTTFSILLPIFLVLLFILNISTPQKLLELAELYYSQEYYTDTIKKLDYLLEKYPNNIDALMLRGKAKYRSGNRQSGLNDFEKAIKLNHNQMSSVSNFLNKVGNEKYHASRYKEAINDYSYAIRLNPSDALSYFNRGRTKNKLGKYLTAIQDYDRVIQLDPDNANAYFWRGISRIKLNDKNSAKQDLLKAKQLYLKNNNLKSVTDVDKWLNSL